MSKERIIDEEEALKKLEEICSKDADDIESMHYYADELLCRLLEKDYPNLVQQFKSLPKWYA